MVRSSKSVSSEQLEAVRRPLEEASNLPGSLYVAPEIHAVERREIFSRMWLCVAREEDLADRGDYVAVDVAGEPIVATRAGDGALRAFYNVCRHRGAVLVDEGSGNAGRCLRCPYHAWTYELDGRLAGAPFMDRVSDFRPEEHALVPVRLDTWGGFVFVNLSDEAEPLEEFLADFPDVSRYRLDELRRGHRIRYEVDANWKIICENYGECYHCAVAHPQLNRISDFTSGGKSMAGESFCGGPMELNDGFTTLSMDGQSELPPIPGLSEEDHRTVHYFNVYPNLLLGLHPDYVLVHHLWPEGPERTRVVCDFLFTREALAGAPGTDEADADPRAAGGDSGKEGGFDPGAIVEFWDLTNRQDWELCERVQRGVRSRGHRAGRYQSLEASVHSFDNWIVERLRPHLDRIAATGPMAGRETQAPQQDGAGARHEPGARAPVP